MTIHSPSTLLSSALLLCSVVVPSVALAAIPECRNLRLEDVTTGGCELQASADCNVSCDRLGIYKKACATKLHNVCRTDCTLSADVTCTDECTVSCESECDRGVSITCIHNCFAECVGSCDATCSDAADPAQCRATCEATCDGECDIQCRPVVDGDCYTHCIECCGGSCKAQANMDCQTTCQDEEFESCEHEFEAECSGSCDVDGALFCNGEYMLSGPDMVDCVQALVARGTLEASVQVGGGISLGSSGNNPGPAALSNDAKASAGCHTSAGPSKVWGGAPLLGLLALARLRRRRP